MPRSWCVAHGSAVSSTTFVPLTLRAGRAHTSGPDGVPILIPVPGVTTPAGEKDNQICSECKDLNSKLVGRSGGGGGGGGGGGANPTTAINALDAVDDSSDEEDADHHTREIQAVDTLPQGYILGQKLGQGSYGSVHLCTKDGNKYAVKVIPKSTVSDQRAKDQLEREIETMRSLKHPNVVGFVDRFDDAKSIYVVMEYASRGDMFDLLEQHAGGVPEKIAARLFYQAVNAVDYIHSKGVLHRDLKPENFFMAKDGTVKLGDFGFSNFMTSGGQKRILKTPCGSAVYVAPEIINKEPQGPFVDVWSLGVSLYTLVSAQDPWQKRGKALTVVEQYHLILAGAFNKLPSSVSAECQDLIKRMICVDKKKRITLGEALKHAWFKKQGVV